MTIPPEYSEYSDPPRRVLEHWGRPLANTLWERLPASDSFSRAILWKTASPTHPALLVRRLPRSESQLADNPIAFRHERMLAARRAGIDFIAAPLGGPGVATWCYDGGHLYEVCRFLPGDPVDPDRIGDAHLEAIGGGLGRLHRCWRDGGPLSVGLSVGFQKRVRMLSQPMLPISTLHPGLRTYAADLESYAGRLPDAIAPLRGLHLPLQTAIADSRLNHFLFCGERLTGLIDLTTARMDTPLIDLARVLGDLNDYDRCWPVVRRNWLEAGMDLPPGTEELLPRAIFTGDVCACLHWFEKLSLEYPHHIAIPLLLAARLENLIYRRLPRSASPMPDALSKIRGWLGWK